MADEINKPLIDPAEQDVLMREMFRGTPQPTISPARMDPIPMTRPTTGPITQPNVNPMPVNFGGQNIPPVPRTGPITGGITQPGINPMPINLGGQNISPRGPIPRMQEGGPVQEGGMSMPPGGMPTGETANAGIMEGFNNPEGQAVAEKIATDFNSIRNHEDVMNMIRGDEKTVEERKAELADVVGEEDAEATPDSSLTITQFGMKQITEANQQLEQGEEPEGIASLPEGQEAIDMDQGALMGAQPEVPQVPETVMPGMAFGGMVQGYAYGGEVTKEGVPVQQFPIGGLALAPWLARTGMAIPLLRRYSMKKGREIFAKKGKKSPGVKKLGEVLKKEEASPMGLFKIKGLTGRQKIYKGSAVAGAGYFGLPGGEDEEKSLIDVPDKELSAADILNKKVIVDTESPKAPVLTGEADITGLAKNKKDALTLRALIDEYNINKEKDPNYDAIDVFSKKNPDEAKKLINSAKMKDAKENKALFKEMMKPSSDYYKRQAWFQLAQFGLNLASSKGGQSLTSAIATSAKEPMAAVAALGAEKRKEERDQDIWSIQQSISHNNKMDQIAAQALATDKRPSQQKLFEYLKTLPMNKNKSDEEIWSMTLASKNALSQKIDALNTYRQIDEYATQLMTRHGLPINDQSFGVAQRASLRIQEGKGKTLEDEERILQEEATIATKKGGGETEKVVKKAVGGEINVDETPTLTQAELNSAMNDEELLSTHGGRIGLLETIKGHYPQEDFNKFDIPLGD